MKCLCLLTLLALTSDLGWGQELRTLPTSWVADDFPNPLVRPRDCGLDDKPGYVCDPNRLLTRHQLQTLNWFLQGIADTENVRECPCSHYHCENYNGQRFYKVAVALVPSLKKQPNEKGDELTALDQANAFAYRLEHDLWNMSVCEEDIVILFSRDDKALVTMTGQTAGRKLDGVSRQAIHSIVGRHFADGRINEGLERMVHEIKLVLTGKTKYYGQLGARTGGAGHSCLGGSPLHFVLLALSSLWLAHSLTASQ